MMSLFVIGFFIGMKHAMEADHVAAVASLTSGNSSLAQTLKQGAAWGMGHTITLFIIGSIVIWMDTLIPEQVAAGLEGAVGLMLVFLGIDVLYKLYKQKIHFHLHQHGDTTHFHAHSHAGDSKHDAAAHQHQHTQGFPFRFLYVGLMHGMAGSAALIVLTVNTFREPWQGMLYMLLFGVGSILGMALLSATIAFPLRKSATGLTWLHNGLQLVIGIFTLGLGSQMFYSQILA